MAKRRKGRGAVGAAGKVGKDSCHLENGCNYAGERPSAFARQAPSTAEPSAGVRPIAEDRLIGLDVRGA